MQSLCHTHGKVTRNCEFSICVNLFSHTFMSASCALSPVHFNFPVSFAMDGVQNGLNGIILFFEISLLQNSTYLHFQERRLIFLSEFIRTQDEDEKERSADGVSLAHWSRRELTDGPCHKCGGNQFYHRFLRLSTSIQHLLPSETLLGCTFLSCFRLRAHHHDNSSESTWHGVEARVQQQVKQTTNLLLCNRFVHEEEEDDETTSPYYTHITHLPYLPDLLSTQASREYF